MVADVRNILPKLIDICRSHGVRCAWVFGSATGRGVHAFTAESDLDLLVEFDDLAVSGRGFNHPLFRLPELLEPLVGRRVQVTENQPFENPYFRDHVMKSRELIYDDRREEAPVGHPSIG